MASSSATGTDGPASDALLKLGRFFTRWDETADGRAVFREGGRKGDAFYRNRWSHDKVVRSTHGVNCTGSCSWKVYVKDGIITWEAQETDYPTVGPDRPEYEPRGCPRGAAFSWYTYSPTRVRFPYIRAVLLEMYRDAKRSSGGDPVLAWESLIADPEKRRTWQQARGKGGLVRSSWQEALEMTAAAHVSTVKNFGPDRCTGFSPIPAMSMVSHAAGARFINLIGGVMNSFYDWYADLPVASPQVFGDQTDVPESGDWWDATYLMMWGSNIPVTRTPDAHWMVEGRYRGTKVVSVSPDYADNTKFADEWLPVQAGSDAAMAMAMGHVVLKENFVDRRVPFFEDYVLQYTDLPFLVTLVDGPGGTTVPGKFLTAQDLGGDAGEAADAAFKTVLLDRTSGAPVVPNGSLGFRYNDDDAGKWNLDLDGVVPALSLADAAGWLGETSGVDLPVFSDPSGAGSVVHRGVPVTTVAGKRVTTVFDLMLAQYGVGREGLPGDWAAGYDDAATAYTPAWQEELTSVKPSAVIRTAREFAANAEKSKGRSMIILGAGICQWYHGDVTYRAILAMLMLTGCEGRNGGGWAHYVGQEKCRPITGWAAMASAGDWNRPPRFMIGTAFWYMHTDQFRSDGYSTDAVQSPLAEGHLRGMHSADVIAKSTRMGWMPFFPQFDAKNSLDVADEAAGGVARGEAPTEARWVADRLKEGKLRFAVEDVDAPENWPRTLILWRSNLLGSSAKGEEYFQKHLLGTLNNVMGKDHGDARPKDVAWREDAPQGKLDLLVSADFRMTSSTLLSDVVFPAATWYEKYDLSSTDMHPYVHAFTPAIAPPWEAKSDFDLFRLLADEFSRQAGKHLGVRKDLVATALTHDTPGEIAQPGGHAPDWKDTEIPAVPGVNLPNLAVVERDYTAIGDKFVAMGPLAEKLGFTTKYVTYDVSKQVRQLAAKHGVFDSGAARGRPAVDTDARMAEAILLFSGTTNGELAVQGFETLEKRTGTPLADLAIGAQDKLITFRDTQDRPTPVITSPEWSGSESGGRRYAPFTINIERLKPFHTLTGRMHFFLDHDWIRDMGEALPVFRPPLDMARLFGEPQLGTRGELSVAVRYLTPHNKWSIHSEYQDNLFMLSLSRGGTAVWMSPQDAELIQVRDNDWVECVNTNGVLVGRAIVSSRMPAGVVYVHHAQERIIDTPKSEATGRRGGIHNSVTRILVKPTHMIGGYAQLSWAFNYLGPTGNQRDIVSVVRRRSQEVSY
ncbi:nitrate reductase subunit alpha [Arthrobacter sp. zg-Y916]|uniref:nitrate reductase subunit alpha n=1 Tax=Arthrobacter sp. zg-Y916 TaxID=2894190 RepID=UPI001E38361D|nr:nitrate reductase subunit alpha [Arthrobacter sp. zg-Y916]MCC9192459.1 nitrate reductase subunit alpha [Arthrobacter sp. zg-Y916]